MLLSIILLTILRFKCVGNLLKSNRTSVVDGSDFPTTVDINNYRREFAKQRSIANMNWIEYNPKTRKRLEQSSCSDLLKVMSRKKRASFNRAFLNPRATSVGCTPASCPNLREYVCQFDIPTNFPESYYVYGPPGSECPSGDHFDGLCVPDTPSRVKVKVGKLTESAMAHVKPNKTTTHRAKSMTTRHQIESTTQTSPSSQLGFLAGLVLCVLSVLNLFSYVF